MSPCRVLDLGWLMKSFRSTKGGKTYGSRCRVRWGVLYLGVLGSSSERRWESQGRMIWSSYSFWLHCNLVAGIPSSSNIRFSSFDTWRILLDEECLPSFEVVNWRLKLLAIRLGEVWGLHMNVILSFSAVCLDLSSIYLIVRHNLVLSVLWSMLSINSLHCLLLWSDVAFLTAGMRRDHACICRINSPPWPGIPLGLVACIAYVFQWGYDGNQPPMVSLGTTSSISGNQLEDDRSSVAFYLLSASGLVSLLEVDVGSVPGGRWGDSCL